MNTLFDTVILSLPNLSDIKRKKRKKTLEHQLSRIPPVLLKVVILCENSLRKIVRHLLSILFREVMKALIQARNHGTFSIFI
jgi:hypothetical protein